MIAKAGAWSKQLNCRSLPASESEEVKSEESVELSLSLSSMRASLSPGREVGSLLAAGKWNCLIVFVFCVWIFFGLIIFEF